MNVVVVIPLYKAFAALDEEEVDALAQCLKKLGSHPISLVAPGSLSLHAYQEIFNKAAVSFTVSRFDDQFFKDFAGYNRLLLSTGFYKKFKQYRYMLIYQLDCWVFRDELQYWCDKGYDYIGSPWFTEIVKYAPGQAFLGVGNGGFSLRNISKMHKVLMRVSRLRKLYGLWQKLKLEKLIRFNRFILRLNFHFKIGKFWELPGILDDQPIQEDEYIGHRVAKAFADFTVPEPAEALKFSFEVNPRYLYTLNHEQLPFGCHAWKKHDPDFWKPFIP